MFHLDPAEVLMVFDLFGRHFEVTVEHIWVMVGFLGQGLFTMRFVVQWFASEKERKSVIPVAFWYFSISGGLTLFTYALWRGDPVFIAGQGLGMIIYFRNLYFIVINKRMENENAAGG